MNTRKLKDISVSFISLVSKGANRKTIIWKTDKNGKEDDSMKEKIKEIRIVKTDEEKRMVYGIVYSPDEVDTDGDYANAEEIEKAAHRFMVDGRAGYSVDKQHDYHPEYGYVAESWIVKEKDNLFPDDAGAWAVGIKVIDENTWEEIKKGEITGLSMAGNAHFEMEDKEFNKFFSFLKKALGMEKNNNKESEDDMDEKKVKEIVSTMIDEKTKAIEKSLSVKIDGMAKKMDESLDKIEKAYVQKQAETQTTQTQTQEKVVENDKKVSELEKSIKDLTVAFGTMTNAIISKGDNTPSNENTDEEKSVFSNVVHV